MVRTLPLLAALAAAPAFAQTAETPSAPAAEAPAAGAADGAYGVFAATAVRDLVGLRVRESSGAAIGEVEALVRTGQAVQAVVGVGGFLGFGEHDVTVPLSSFVMTDAGLMLPDLSEAQLLGLPGYEGDLEALPQDVTVAGDPLPEEVPAPID